ncbi:MAG: ribonuclease P protein component [Pseudomonadota bacterium]|nr:ribonuclease P protein component [Pseudomonadota bacterium]
MTPPEASVDGPEAEHDTPPAVSVCLETLKTRPDFLACARARKAPAPAFLLQGRDRGDDDPRARVGFTASKKIGNAVARNRAKRRLREIARAVIGAEGAPGWDYVLVARPGSTVTHDFAEMKRDLSAALARVHGNRG